ncbi:SURF1 family protein [Tateyamaria sp. SN3-11]|uniref:SURF1 family protein n=1 Tax=Tateyamaria sp. SN3-11 TaxID=3092147 RepID=UPI0039EAC3B1
MNRLWFLLTFGLIGTAILVSLGVWQVQRLAWKEGILARIEARIDAPPMPLPATPDPESDAYLHVTVSGQIAPEQLRVLVSQKNVGAGYRIISPMQLDGRKVMVDRGFVRTRDAVAAPPAGVVTVSGNLQWPQETDGFTPAPDTDNNIWFARDVPAMAATLGTAPILIVAKDVSPSDTPPTPFPVDTSRIPNDHLQYAITWFSLAAIWVGMTAYFLLRTPRSPAQKD